MNCRKGGLLKTTPLLISDKIPFICVERARICIEGGIEIGPKTFLCDLPERAIISFMSQFDTISCIIPGSTMADCREFFTKDGKIIKTPIDFNF